MWCAEICSNPRLVFQPLIGVCQQIREKAVKILGKSLDVVQKMGKGGFRVKVSGQTPAKPLQHKIHAFWGGIAVQKACIQHFGQPLPQHSRHIISLVLQLSVCFIGKIHKGFRRIVVPMQSQYVIVQNVDNRWSIAPGKCAKTAHTATGQGMFIRISINGPVQQDPLLDADRVGAPIVALDKIADEIADQDIFVAEGKKTVCEVVQSVLVF